MADYSRSAFETTVHQPTLDRLAALPALIATAEAQLVALVNAFPFDNAAADTQELAVAGLKREQARLHERDRFLANKLKANSGSGQLISI